MTKTALKPALTALCLALGASVASATPYSSVFFFGDSLSDDGNLFDVTGGLPPQPYNERFTNGLVWTEFFDNDFSVSENYAFGGAQATNNFPGPGQDPATDLTVDIIPDLDLQLGLFTGVIPGAALGLTDPVKTVADAGSNPLAVIWLGANDIFNTFDDITLTTPEREAIMQVAAQDVTNAVFALSTVGVSNVVVMNAGDVGVTPSYQLNLGGLLAGEATQLAQTFNTALSTGLASVRSVTGQTITEIDMFSLLQDLVANPADYGVSNVTEPCLWTNELADDRPVGTPPFCGPAVSSFAFFDGVHPTSTV
ncbi:MAG: SGNH/GDSL hydrolase family protein, partial [Pseudomonadota bacterium]